MSKKALIETKYGKIQITVTSDTSIRVDNNSYDSRQDGAGYLCINAGLWTLATFYNPKIDGFSVHRTWSRHRPYGSYKKSDIFARPTNGQEMKILTEIAKGIKSWISQNPGALKQAQTEALTNELLSVHEDIEGKFAEIAKLKADIQLLETRSDQITIELYA